MPKIEIYLTGAEERAHNPLFTLRSVGNKIEMKDCEIDQDPKILDVPADRYSLVFSRAGKDGKENLIADFELSEDQTASFDLKIEESGRPLELKQRVDPAEVAEADVPSDPAEQKKAKKKRSRKKNENDDEDKSVPHFIVALVIVMVLVALGCVVFFFIGAITNDPYAEVVTEETEPVKLEYLNGNWFNFNSVSSDFRYYVFDTEQKKVTVGTYFTERVLDRGDVKDALLYRDSYFNIVDSVRREGTISQYSVNGDVITLTVVVEASEYGAGYTFDLSVRFNRINLDLVTVTESRNNTTMEYRHENVEDLRY